VQHKQRTSSLSSVAETDGDTSKLLQGTERESEDGEEAGNDYFLSGRDATWYVIGGSIFATNIGTEQFIGVAGASARSGLAVGFFEWSACFILILLGWVFAPVYVKSNFTTSQELFEMRFSGKVRFVYAMITVTNYVVTKSTGAVYSGYILLNTIVDITLWESTAIIVCATALYTAVGGLRAVLLTDAVQCVIFIFGGVVGMIVALQKVGGFNGLYERLEEEDLLYYYRMFRSPNDQDYPVTGMLTGLPLSSIW
jgi:SSS family solute:Na+ symporter